MKILVVDDHPLVRSAMAQLVLQLDADVTVLEAPDCLGGLAQVSAHPDLDLVLLDLNLPGLRGMAALDRFRQEYPTTPVVVVSMFRDSEIVKEALRRGATGFIPKSSGQETIVNALRLVLAGSMYVPPEAAFDVGGPHDAAPSGLEGHDAMSAGIGLTSRQGQVLAMVMKGRANKEICRDLGLAERTVKAHLTAVLNALKVTSRTQAVIAANRLGLDADALLAAGQLSE